MVESDQFESETGRNSLVMTPSKWIRDTNAFVLIRNVLLRNVVFEAQTSYHYENSKEGLLCQRNL